MRELNDLYSSPNNVWVIKPRRMRWAGHVARIGLRSSIYSVLVGNMRERDNLGDPGVDRIILRWIIRKWNVGGGGMDWIKLAQDRDKWWAFVNAVINLQVP